MTSSDFFEGGITMKFDLYNFYQDIKDKHIIFCYSGPVAQVGLEGIAQTLRRNLELEQTSNNATFAIFSVFIELMQNVLNYSAERPLRAPEFDPSLRMGIIAVGQDAEGYFVFCGNRICNSDIESTRERIDEIRHLSKDELKSLYKTRRRQGFDTSAKGAGLGLIEMARKAGRPIDYSFAPIDGESSFFSIQVKIRQEGK